MTTKFSIYLDYPRHTERIFKTWDPKYTKIKPPLTREYRKYKDYYKFGEEDYSDDYDLGRADCINPFSGSSQW